MDMPFALRRLPCNPIIVPAMLNAADGDNINGPSLIEAPHWLPGRLARFYLYFAHHRGRYIRLAVADRLEGPWRIVEGGSLHLDQAPGCQDHIASPDVHVDEARKQVVAQFEAAGLVLKHNFEGGHAVYELDRGEHHDHMVDVDTGKVVEFHSDEIEELQRQIAAAHGYEIEDHALVLYVRKKR